MGRRKKLLDPANWASLKPFGAGEGRPNNYKEIIRAIRENRGNLRYAWRILTRGTCDGCALGTKGMRDWTMREVHLCNIRLRLLRLNTMPGLDAEHVADAAELSRHSSTQLRELGRLDSPLIRRAGEAGFTRISWDEALDLAAERLRATPPERTGFYLTSRGTPNENYFAAQKAVRALGTNAIDNAARICHSPSTVALKSALGVAATTCSYADWIGSDLVVFVGSNPANNQPVAMKYLYHAKKAGTRIASINPYREPGMDRYWVPSNLESAVFGTRITDHFFQVNAGGDIGFLNGTLKAMQENDWIDAEFVRAHTSGFDAVAERLAEQPWEELERVAGAPADRMRDFAHLLHEARSAVLVWSMGVTQHEHGEDTVRAIINLALARGFVGREKCGLMPIRGHSGVQGGAEMGAYATAFPGGKPVSEQNARHFSELWGFDVPTEPGPTAPEMIDAAHDGQLDVLVSSGGNFLEVLPDPEHSRRALASVGLRVHIDVCLSSQMLVEPSGEAGSTSMVLVLPAETRYEMAGGVTETSTERRIIFSPEVPGPRHPQAWPEYRIFGELAARTRPDRAEAVRYAGTPEIRADIARSVPMYAGIETLREFGDQVQYGGPRLCADYDFGTDDGLAHFAPVALPDLSRPDGTFRLTTRRGKQFNSMVQENVDSLNGAAREAVLMNAQDAADLGLPDGARVRLMNELGALDGQVLCAPLPPGNLQVHWPEGEVLIERGRRSPAGVPDYNAVVTVEATNA